MWRFKSVLGGLKKLHSMEKDRATRAYIDALIEDQKAGINSVSGEIQAAKMIGVRNPAFDGDYVGYPEDDFDPPQLNKNPVDDEDDKE